MKSSQFFPKQDDIWRNFPRLFQDNWTLFTKILSARICKVSPIFERVWIEVDEDILYAALDKLEYELIKTHKFKETWK